MRSLRRTIQIKEGVAVQTLFTPHLFSFKDEFGLLLEVPSEDPIQIMEAYADVFFLAAVNAWVLDGKGTWEEFPYTRGDFHEYMMSDPRAFGKDVDFAVEALTGKRLRDLSSEQEKAQESQGNGQETGKKKVFRWIGRRSRHSS